MIPVAANWRPHTAKPTEIPVTAVIAARDPDDGEIGLLYGVHTFTKHRDQWWDESTGKPIAHAEFWWLPEEELVAPLLPKSQRA